MRKKPANWTTQNHIAWLATNRTHEECAECEYEYVMPAKCRGHEAGPTPCPTFLLARQQIVVNTTERVKPIDFAGPIKDTIEMLTSILEKHGEDAELSYDFLCEDDGIWCDDVYTVIKCIGREQEDGVAESWQVIKNFGILEQK